MAIDYVNKITTFVDRLRAYNTTTATPDLSSSLTSRIQTITSTEPEISGSRHGFFPLLFVELDNANEEETQIGDYTNRRKIKNMTYNLWGFYKKEGMIKTQSAQLTDFYQMASNVEAVVKRESTLSGTALHFGVVSTNFKEHSENNLIKVFKIETEVKYFYS